ncbi:MAG: DEDD exonuclease domain-containing protein [Ancrocorticia sp.]|jgi:DNA polymerase-3 subunit epsilon|nr:DEDD exonuclease domain-containing protein [Ancrocorticia sp.]MCI1895857.1 DEDD exonuclease domain-containing protein [Ancrocorticia sp.]MCI1932681.1 DEDD exonuclease domain-containing protein [Ancrocorticia sp.]MCI1964258.1 DEDD exonuclease domain-containing protein [Ancrocorticia sp.]MCI2002861.1 DEDD exonuclease domain-containing protein [Ancrocorticia sp.]
MARTSLLASPPGARIDVPPRHGAMGQLSFEDLGLPLYETTFVVVDLETTGTRPEPHSITEFGAVKVRGGEVLGEFATLVNPGGPIPPFITALTGINTAMVMKAPDIAAVLPAFLEFMNAGPETVLVAHNARFDVGHLKAAAAGLGYEWPHVMVLDTVKLARRVFTKDEAPNVKLSTLAALCHATVSPTHRALDDARATVDVLHVMLGRLGPLGVTHREDLVTVCDPVPLQRRKKAVLADGLPQGPGVYHFIGPGGEVMYVGTSVNLYHRVRQYFTAAERRTRIAEMVDLATRVEAIPTATVLEARVRELRDISQFDPPYNRRSRRPQTRPWIQLTDEPHPRLSIVRRLPFDRLTSTLGPFSSALAAKQAMLIITREAKLRTCTTRLPATVRSNAAPCHLYTMGLCYAPCARASESDPAPAHAARILSGEFSDLWDHTMEYLGSLARSERFEQAAEVRDRLAAVHSAVRKREQLLPLLTARQIMAAQRTTSSHASTRWEVVLIHYGKLIASATTDSGAHVPELAQTLINSSPEPKEPRYAGADASVEETEILAHWLWQPETRLLSYDGALPIAVPRHGAASHVLPRAESQSELD